MHIDANQMYQIYALINIVQNNTVNWKMTPNEVVCLILANTENETIKNSIDVETINKLQLISNVMDSSINNQTYIHQELSKIIGTDSDTLKSIYILYVSKKSNTKLTPQEFVNFVLSHKNDELLASNINSSTIEQLNLVQTVMNGTLNNKKYSSAELSDLLGINVEDLNLLYGLYVSRYVSPDQTISLKEFVVFLIDDVMQNPDYSSNFNSDSTSKLNTINGIMNSSLNNTKIIPFILVLLIQCAVFVIMGIL